MYETYLTRYINENYQYIITQHTSKTSTSEIFQSEPITCYNLY